MEKKIAVFYDLDKTLLDGIAGLGFIRLAFKKKMLRIRQFLKIMMYAVGYRFNKFNYEKSVRKNVRLLLTNKSAKECDDLGVQGLDEYVKPRLYDEMLERIEWHKKQGHLQIMVTSAFDSVCNPVYKFLDFDDLCCTFIERENGRFTGSPKMPLCHEHGKAHYIQQLAKKHNIDLSKSYSYADNISDVPMLQMVGNPFATNPDKHLRKMAIDQNWNILDCRSVPRKKRKAREQMETMLNKMNNSSPRGN